MAILKNPISKEMCGNLGNTITYTWDGEVIMRSKPLHVHDPKTEKQLTQRKRFSLINNLYKRLHTIPRLGFMERPPRHSAFNQFHSYNRDTVIVLNDMEYKVQWENLCCAQGSLPESHIMIQYDKSTHSLNVHIDPSITQAQNQIDDEIALILMERNGKNTIHKLIGPRVPQRVTNVPLDKQIQIEEYVAYSFVFNSNIQKSSNSTYHTLT